MRRYRFTLLDGTEHYGEAPEWGSNPISHVASELKITEKDITKVERLPNKKKVWFLHFPSYSPHANIRHDSLAEAVAELRSLGWTVDDDGSFRMVEEREVEEP